MPEVSAEAYDYSEAFFSLMNMRSGDTWITIQDIKTYMELFPVVYREWFPRLILSAQRAYMGAQKEAKDRTERLQAKVDRKGKSG